MPARYGKDGTIGIVENPLDTATEIRCTYNAIVRKIKHMQATATPYTYAVAAYYLELLAQRCAALSRNYGRHENLLPMLEEITEKEEYHEKD